VSYRRHGDKRQRIGRKNTRRSTGNLTRKRGNIANQITRRKGGGQISLHHLNTGTSRGYEMSYTFAFISVIEETLSEASGIRPIGIVSLPVPAQYSMPHGLYDAKTCVHPWLCRVTFVNKPQSNNPLGYPTIVCSHNEEPSSLERGGGYVLCTTDFRSDG